MSGSLERLKIKANGKVMHIGEHHQLHRLSENIPGLVMKRLQSKCQAHWSEAHENQQTKLRPVAILKIIETALKIWYKCLVINNVTNNANLLVVSRIVQHVC